MLQEALNAQPEPDTQEEEDPNIAFLKHLQIDEKFHGIYMTALNFYKRTVGVHVNSMPPEFEKKEKLLNVF